MKITQEVDYALRVILYLSKLGFGEKIEAKVISENENVPHRFLLKLLRKLTQAGIVKSYRGVTGGYALNKRPEHVSLYDVVVAIDGPIYVNRCLNDKDNCNKSNTDFCKIHKALASVQQNLIDNLESINFGDLLKED
ncbi:RrF2 family transcriptional regulator [Clostridium hydrogeniformans]|uniref:RrF2 family transcriptional regulator n=1 Tax=Clostridium hydrogeniformans TaxID=349933 RepID=UPI00047F1A3A|nr:Rrf2 family transcriptional regulator [Clostridium hydrogeniformans]